MVDRFTRFERRGGIGLFYKQDDGPKWDFFEETKQVSPRLVIYVQHEGEDPMVCPSDFDEEIESPIFDLWSDSRRYLGIRLIEAWASAQQEGTAVECTMTRWA